MSQQGSLLEKNSRKGIVQRRRRRAAHWSIGMSICLNADVRRIFQLLTVGEYLETWLCFPGSEPDAHVSAFRHQDEYRLECFSDGRPHASISGSYRACRQRKVLFSWNHHGLSSGGSLVDIRLRGNFGSSILELRHTDLSSAVEYFWQMAMWRASFERLVRLTKNSLRTLEAGRAR